MGRGFAAPFAAPRWHAPSLPRAGTPLRCPTPARPFAALRWHAPSLPHARTPWCPILRWHVLARGAANGGTGASRTPGHRAPGSGRARGQPGRRALPGSEGTGGRGGWPCGRARFTDSEEPDSEEPGSEEPGSEEPDSEEPDSEEPGSEEPESEVARAATETAPVRFGQGGRGGSACRRGRGRSTPPGWAWPWRRRLPGGAGPPGAGRGGARNGAGPSAAP
jgi:hypothetical protein